MLKEHYLSFIMGYDIFKVMALGTPLFVKVKPVQQEKVCISNFCKHYTIMTLFIQTIFCQRRALGIPHHDSGLSPDPRMIFHTRKCQAR